MQGVTSALGITEAAEQRVGDVAVIDVRGSVDTQPLHDNLEASTYTADYDRQVPAHYLDGHIPGAVFWDWTSVGIDEDDEAPIQLQTNAGLFAAEMEAMGIGTDRPAVIYDNATSLLAARVWWALSYHGHPRPLVLEGGFAKWVAEGRTTELLEPCPVNASFELQQWHTGCTGDHLTTSLAAETLRDAGKPYDSHQASFRSRPGLATRATADDVLAVLTRRESPGESQGERVLLLDARNSLQWSGRVRRAERGGRIPGAVNVPRGALLQDTVTGTFKPLEEQRQVLSDVGVAFNGQQRVITYCNGGVASCSVLLALSRTGHTNFQNFDASWNFWGNEPGLPIEL
eukprot:jgi/Astpho2/5951/Aster-x1316